MHLLRRKDFSETGSRIPHLWGMLHLRALPGSPRFSGSVDEVLDAALADATALVNTGFRGLVVENFGDRPFVSGAVDPVTVAGMTRIAAAVRREWPELHLIVNCLRNDAESGLAVAIAAGRHRAVTVDYKLSYLFHNLFRQEKRRPCSEIALRL